jgi:hypothetical protein
MWNRVIEVVRKSLYGPAARRRPTVRPRVVELEDRAVPATFTVTNLNDFGLGSLRQATADANAAPGLDDIVFAGAATSGTITLTGGQMFLNGPTNLIGPGAGNLTISGNNTTRIFQIQPGGGQPVNISGLTFTKGNGSGGLGGAIYNNGGHLTIESSVLTGNFSPAHGGAIFSGYSGSLLTIRNSTISGNTTNNHGGGIYSRSYTGPNGTRIENSTISGNTANGVGGGVRSMRSPLQVVNSTISGNTSNGAGGGVFIEQAPVGVTSSTISGNRTNDRGGGIWGYRSSLQMVNSTISGNTSNAMGGGMYLRNGNAYGVSSLIDRSTISGNRTNNHGGGMFVISNTLVEVRSSTISGNSAGGHGGGAYFVSGGVLTLRNSTVAENTLTGTGVAGGLFLASTTHSIESSIVANNKAPANPAGDDVWNASQINSIRGLYRVVPGANGFNGINQNNIIADPQLGPLANNGGPTWTHGLMSTSPAVDTGSNPTGQQFDQRGSGNPRVENGIPDIGAVEWDTALVINTNDSGFGSLRAAVQAANQTNDITPIRFAPNVAGAIALNSDLSLVHPIDVVGPGAGALTVFGGNLAPLPGPTLTIPMRGLTWSNPVGVVIDFNLIATGDLVIDAGPGPVTIKGELTATAGNLALTSASAVNLGPLTVLAGGSLSAANGFAVGTGEMLTGTGTLTGDLTVQSGGNVAPGPLAGAITVVGDVTVQPGATLLFDLNGPAPSQHDRLIVNGTVDLGSGLNFNPVFGFTPPPGTALTLVVNDGSDAPGGTLNDVPNRAPITLNGVLHQMLYDSGDGNDVVILANMAPVINPAVTTKLDSINEDTPTGTNPGTTVDDLLGTGGLYADGAGAVQPGLAVTSLDTANGTWQFSLDGGANWTTFGAVAPSSATMLAADGAGQSRIRFLPAANFAGTAAISFKGWDGLDGSANGATGVNTAAAGGYGPFSAQTETAAIHVISTNDVPDAVNDLAVVVEDSAGQGIPVLANDTGEAGETLTISAVTQGLHGTVTITGGGTGLTYTPDPDYAGPDTFFYWISDGNGGTDSAAVSVTVTNDADDRLEVVTSPGTTQFTEGGGPVAVDGGPNGVQVGDGLEGVLTKATVKFASGYVKAKDKLVFTPLPNIPIKGAFSATTGTLTLTGTASPADYQAALRAVTFNNTSPLPVTGLRKLEIRVQDAAGVGDPAVKLLYVTGVNTKPTLTLTSSALAYTRGKPAIAVASTLGIKDVDNTRLQGATVQITGGFAANQDVLSVTLKPGITRNYDAATGILTLSGNATLATYLAVLKSVKFSTPAAAPAGARTISFTVTDGDLTSDPITRTVNVS